MTYNEGELSRMRVKRITANIRTSDIDKADAFYHDVLGLKVPSNPNNWILGYPNFLTYY
jgi:catechol 2,3-dioxygenase-like lactoylglutathione lyase family enzyme